jgi:hypothetical protein
MNLRERFKNETKGDISVKRSFDCDNCGHDVVIDVWNDEYINWLENKANSIEQLFNLVNEMRNLQQRYFSTKDRTTLQRCKDIESKVDRMIHDKLSNQIEIFKT